MLRIKVYPTVCLISSSSALITLLPFHTTMPPDRQRTQRIVRVRTGCWSCRRRKKKCDEARPICGGCMRNDLGCQWPSTVPGRKHSGPPEEFTRSDLDDRRDSEAGVVEELGSISTSGSPSPRRLSSGSSVGAQSVEGGEPLDLDGATILDGQAHRRQSSTSNCEDSVISKTMVGNVVPRTLSMLPGYDAESYQLLSHYLGTTADCMANGTTPINPFLVQVVPLAFTSDLLLQLVITQSAAHRAFRRGDESDSLAQSHYTKSIQLFRKGVTEFIDGKEPNPLMLLVGALLMCFTEVRPHRHLQRMEILTTLVDCQGGHDWHSFRSLIGRQFTTCQTA